MTPGPDAGLRSIFRERLPTIHWQTIETGLVGRGVPDANGCLNGVEFWIEYKRADAWAVPLMPEQVAWLLRRTRAGGRTFVAVRRVHLVSARRAACDELWLYRGAAARELKDVGLRTVPLGTWEGGPGRWDWSRVQALLLAE